MKSTRNNNWRRRSIMILCRILICFCFFVPWPEFLHVVSNFLEITALYFFTLVGASFSSKNICKQQAATRHFADFIVRENKRFLLLLVQQQTAKSAAEFSALVLTRKQSANQQKKIQGCDFLLNWRPHAKIQLIWREKKTDQNST